MKFRRIAPYGSAKKQGACKFNHLFTKRKEEQNSEETLISVD
jgi:hypothetical protein